MSDSFYTNACIKLGKNNFKKNKSQKEGAVTGKEVSA